MTGPTQWLRRFTGWTLSHMRQRSGWIEKWLQIPMGDAEAAAVIEACHGADARIGAFYRWYWDKARVAQILRMGNGDTLLAWVRRWDRTNYAEMDCATESARPLIVAIPHHGHYILSIIGIVERLRSSRGVMVFYADPRTRPGNALFDVGVRDSAWSKLDSGVQILHDDRAGLTAALQGLRQRKVLIILPDVTRCEEQAYLLPFMGRAFNAMLGTAALARKTGSVILPAVSAVPATGTGFCTHFGPLMQTARQPADVHASLLADYARTCDVFATLETLMRGDLFRWQFVREHFTSKLQLPQLEPDHLEMLADALLSSSRAGLHAAHASHIS